MASKSTFRLINPYIEGSLNTEILAKNAFSAGKKLYSLLSNYFTNHVENFYMTIQNKNNGELTHFLVNELREKTGGNVSYNLIKINDKFSSDMEKRLVESFENMKNQKGGKHHHHHKDDSSSDSTSSSSEYYYKIPLSPITKFAYFYVPYYTLNVVGVNPCDLSKIFIPTFGFPINPTIEFNFDVYKYF
jgi:hypothetical protein